MESTKGRDHVVETELESSSKDSSPELVDDAKSCNRKRPNDHDKIVPHKKQ